MRTIQTARRAHVQQCTSCVEKSTRARQKKERKYRRQRRWQLCGLTKGWRKTLPSLEAGQLLEKMISFHTRLNPNLEQSEYDELQKRMEASCHDQENVLLQRLP